MQPRHVFAWMCAKVTWPIDGESKYSQNPECARLMSAAQMGDADAYRRLLHEIVPDLRSQLRSHQHPPERIDETVADVLRAIHRLRHTYDPVRPFGGWLSAIAGHCAAKARAP